jgi:hypothetical protein
MLQRKTYCRVAACRRIFPMTRFEFVNVAFAGLTACTPAGAWSDRAANVANDSRNMFAVWGNLAVEEAS